MERIKTRQVDTREYVSVLRELVEQGHSVSMLISGSSMNPFLCHHRDVIYFEKPERALKNGDMVFYQRENGQYVMHRIVKVRKNGEFELVGDAQTCIEHGVRREQIFALVTRVKRKGREIAPGDFWWFFFARIWPLLIPFRRLIMAGYAKLKKG